MVVGLPCPAVGCGGFDAEVGGGDVGVGRPAVGNRAGLEVDGGGACGDVAGGEGVGGEEADIAVVGNQAGAVGHGDVAAGVDVDGSRTGHSLDVRSGSQGNVVAGNKAEVAGVDGEVFVDRDLAGDGLDEDIAVGDQGDAVVIGSVAIVEGGVAGGDDEDDGSGVGGGEVGLGGVEVGGGGIAGHDIDVHTDVVDGDGVGLGEECALGGVAGGGEGIDGDFQRIGGDADVVFGGDEEAGGLDVFLPVSPASMTESATVIRATPAEPATISPTTMSPAVAS